MVLRRRPDPSAAHLAGAYIRISDPRKQGDNHSPEVQREGIRRLAQQLGYIIAQWEQDEERGRIVTRGGYLRLLEACRAGQLGAILVFSLSRWGRKASERLERGDELDRLGITLYSVQQGADEAGIVRGVQAVVDEEASRQLARNIRPAREAGARHGTHQGPDHARQTPPRLLASIPPVVAIEEREEQAGEDLTPRHDVEVPGRVTRRLPRYPTHTCTFTFAISLLTS